LQILEREGASSLDQLTIHTAWPKSSVLRILRSLEAFGAVDRDPASKRYRAALRLVPISAGGNRLHQAARSELVGLAETTGHSSELFVWDGTELVMIDRADPDAAEVVVRNRVGTSRNLDELEAVSQIVHAWSDTPPCPAYWAWVEGGVRGQLNAQAVTQRIETARQGLGDDLAPNSFGIARLAAPLRGPDGGLLGVLSLARLHSARTSNGDQRAAAALTATAAQISSRCGCPS
jgi:DNA-binding IclR family transcriptional regulator